MPQILQIAVIAAATLGTGAAALSALNEDIPDLVIPEGAWTDEAALDGRVFRVYAHDVESGAELEDDLLFRDGTFLSTDCQEYCDFGWSDYQTKTVDGVIHFTTVMRCPDAPHTVVWYGTVEGDALKLEATWTTRRWYWTNQIVLDGEGLSIPAEASKFTG